jgi:hypothetical protein
MRDVLLVGWIVVFSVALALALTTRRALAWAAFALLAIPAAYVIYAIRYGTR